MPKFFPPKYGNPDPMGPEPKNAGETAPMYGNMFKFQYDPANLLTITAPVYVDTAERDADPRIAKAPNGTMIIVGSQPQTKIGGNWMKSTVTT